MFNLCRGFIRDAKYHIKIRKSKRVFMIFDFRYNPHPNIVRLVGIAALEEPLLIVMELANNGSLDEHLRNHGYLYQELRLVIFL